LKTLDLGGNQIGEIDSNGFQGLEDLEELNLIYNKLTKIESNPFRNLKKLQKIDFSGNYELDSNAFRQHLANIQVKW
jgi:Leucine-rich repeat (LRR) protein